MAKNTPHFPMMENMTVKQVDEYLKRRQSIIIPVGVIEQHGYHLPLCVDALIAKNLSRMIGEKTGILVAPTMYESFSGGGCPGTINISPAVMSLVISDLLVSLVSQGFKNIFLFLCHGGSENARAIEDAIKILLRTNPAFEKVIVSLSGVWDFDPNGIAWKKAIKEGDWHAGWLETSMVMALAPELVQMDQLALDEKKILNEMIAHPDNYQHAEKPVDDKLIVPRMRQRDEVKVGVMGFPERASAELGRKMIEDIVAAAGEKFREIESKADGVYKEVSFTPASLIFD